MRSSLQVTSPSARLQIFISLLGITALLPACERALPLGDSPLPGPVAPVDLPPSSYCLPQTRSHASTEAPELYAWILEAEQRSCHLASRTSSGNELGFRSLMDSFAPPGTESCDETGCWSELPAFARTWTHVPGPEPYVRFAEYFGEQWTGTVRAARNRASGELRATLVAMEYGSSAVRRFERRFDAAGHLLEDRHYFADRLWFTTINTWEGDHLIASRFLDSVNGSGETDYTWTYAGDRLLGARAIHLQSGQVASVAFSYDDEGRLIEARRTLDGQQWAHQAWSYGGGFVSRSSTTLAPVRYPSATTLRETDDLEPLITASHQLEWQAARPPTPAVGACASLPHALHHGYPEADGVYALGWPVRDRPNGIDTDYGFGPAYDSAQHRWFGHDRVEAYAYRVPWEAPTVQVDIDRDVQGRMVRETLTSSDDSVSWVRSRRFEAQRLSADTRVLHHGDQELRTELSFDYDSADHLVRRSYRMNGIQVARHSWSYAGRQISRHEIAHHPLVEQFVGPVEEIIPAGLEALPEELPPPIVHERSYSPDGRRLEIRREGALIEDRSFDDAGRILSRTVQTGRQDVFGYEPEGALRSYGADWDGDSSLDQSLSYERAADGRLLQRSFSYSPQRSGLDVFSYSCP